MKKIKLGDVCKINAETYSDSNSCDFVNYLDTSNITANHIENIQHIDITQEKLPSRARRKVKFNSIIYSTVRPNQRHYGIIKSQPENFLVSTGFAVIDVDPKKIDANFLYYQLSRDEIVNNLQSIAEQSTTAYPSIKPSDLSNLKFYVPSLDTQRKIGNFLYALDDKIALNKKINATLESMAKTLYMHEFFRKTPNGKLGDIVIENSKSIIPVGAAKLTGGKFPFFTSGDSVLSWTDSLVDGRNIFLNDGGNAGVKFYVGKAAYSTHTYSISTKENLADYICLLLKIIEPELDKRFFTGTGLKNLRKDLLKERAIYIPTKTEREQFNAIVQPCFTKISANVRENRRLAELRDWLLPMLMNGQIQFKET